MKLLVSKNIKFCHIAEIARLCPYPVGDKSTATAQKWILYHQFLTELIANELGILTIMDRCVIDHYAYYQYWLTKGELDLSNTASNYNSVFLFPPNKNFLIGDGLRPINIEFQEKIDISIRGIHNKYSSNYNLYTIDPLKISAIKLVIDILSACKPKAMTTNIDYDLVFNKINTVLPFYKNYKEIISISAIDKVLRVENDKKVFKSDAIINTLTAYISS